jgi:hypothetical protein
MVQPKKLNLEQQVEEEFPLQILYSSPPEAERLAAWIEAAEEKRRRASEDQAGTRAE